MSWRIYLNEELREQACRITIDVATRLSNPHVVMEQAGLVNAQSGLAFQKHWAPIKLSFGNAGVALLFGQLDQCFPGHGWATVAHEHLVLGAQMIEAEAGAAHSLSLFSGLSGFCLATHMLSRNGKRYQRLLGTLDSLLFEYINETTDELLSVTAVSFGDYDLIGGTTGIAAYLLERRADYRAMQALEPLLDRLITLALSNDNSGFFIRPETLPTAEHVRLFPDGATDCGLAHGVPGPLGILSLAQCAGIERPGLTAAIRATVDWLLHHRADDQWGVNWPHAVAPVATRAPGALQAGRAAWCYGSPGVATALWLAGEALDDDTVRCLAIEAIRAVMRRPTELWRLPGPIICHGIAGLLQIVLRCAQRSDDLDLIRFAQSLTGQLVNLYEPDARFGFRDIEPDHRRIDNPGFLEGAAGIALVLLAASTEIDPHWDRALLLS